MPICENYKFCKFGVSHTTGDRNGALQHKKHSGWSSAFRDQIEIVFFKYCGCKSTGCNWSEIITSRITLSKNNIQQSLQVLTTFRFSAFGVYEREWMFTQILGGRFLDTISSHFPDSADPLGHYTSRNTDYQIDHTV